MVTQLGLCEMAAISFCRFDTALTKRVAVVATFISSLPPKPLLPPRVVPLVGWSPLARPLKAACGAR